MFFNLYPQFINETNKDNPTASLCGSCVHSISKGNVPAYSLAAGIDFGSPYSLGLQPLSLVEELCIALGRPYMTIIKLAGSQPEERQRAHRGHVFTVPQSNDAILEEIEKMKIGYKQQVFPKIENVSKYFGIVFVGTRQQWDALIPNHYSQMEEIKVEAHKIYGYLRALKAVHPAYKDILIDDSDIMTASIANIPALLLSQVEIMDGEVENKIETIVEQENNPTENNDPLFISSPLQSAFLTRSSSISNEDNSSTHILTSKIKKKFFKNKF